jgi:hypothetical protein
MPLEIYDLTQGVEPERLHKLGLDFKELIVWSVTRQGSGFATTKDYENKVIFCAGID